jgi:hypothetical protein
VEGGVSINTAAADDDGVRLRLRGPLSVIVHAIAREGCVFWDILFLKAGLRRYDERSATDNITLCTVMYSSVVHNCTQDYCTQLYAM